MKVYVVIQWAGPDVSDCNIIAVYSDKSAAEARLKTSGYTNGSGEFFSYYAFEEHELMATEETAANPWAQVAAK